MSERAKKLAVIYNSKYGSTKRYAEWIAEGTKGELWKSSEVNADDLQKYDVLVFGGSLHAVGIKGIKLIRDNFQQLKDKKIIVFGVGASTIREEAIKHVLEHNFTDTMKEKIYFFLLRGAFNYKELSFVDKMLMNALRLKLKMKKEEDLDEESRGLLASFSTPIDWTDKKAVIPIIECIKQWIL